MANRGTFIDKRDALARIRVELQAGMQLAKCQQCGCMRGALDALSYQLQAIPIHEAADLAVKVAGWQAQMKPVRYACLGCEVCYPAVAENTFAAAFPESDHPPVLACEFQATEGQWPPVLGEYFVLDEHATVAVSTLGSVQLAEELAALKPAGLAIVGKTETENIGIDKIVKNVVANPAIRNLVVAGVDAKGHQPGNTLIALVHNGVDESGRVIGSEGKRPILRNVSPREVEAFRSQVQVIDLRDCADATEIGAQVEHLVSPAVAPCGCGDACSQRGGISPTQDALPDRSLPRAAGIEDACADPTCTCHQELSAASQTRIATDPGQAVTLDRAGYFVILPVPDRNVINVEHYAYDNSLLHVIEGPNARALYLAIVGEGWVTELSHAAYLGKELAKAELSLKYGFRYIQDGA